MDVIINNTYYIVLLYKIVLKSVMNYTSVSLECKHMLFDVIIDLETALVHHLLYSSVVFVFLSRLE